MADKDTRLEGGPYNGNSFYIPEESNHYTITSSSGSAATRHVYLRNDEGIFVYDHTENV